MTTKKNRVQFSDEEVGLIRAAALDVWQEVGFDCLQATAEEKGKDIERVSIPRAVVIEIALDASRPDEKLRRATRGWDEARRADFFKRFGEVEYEQLKALVRPAFPDTRYGL